LNPTTTLGDISPLEALSHNVPDYDRLKVFGSRCFPCLRNQRENKLSPKSKPCVFLGYPRIPRNQDGYLCYDPVDHKLYVSRDVRFVEGEFSLNRLLKGEEPAPEYQLKNYSNI